MSGSTVESALRIAMPILRRQWVVVVLVELLLVAAMLTMEAYGRQRRVAEQVAAVAAAGGNVWLAAPLWQQKLAAWRNLVSQQQTWWATQEQTWVFLKGTTFDDQWLRDHDQLEALKIDMLIVSECPVTASGVGHLVAEHPIKYLNLRDVTNCDGLATALAMKESLRIVCFDDTDLSDAGFCRLPLETLAGVSVAGTKVTPAGLLELQRCRQLNSVWLDGRQFDDSVAELLRVQRPITMLELLGKDVTDEHLQRIHGMSVVYVCLTDVSVTPQGVTALQQALPKCRVRVHSTAGRTEDEPSG